MSYKDECESIIVVPRHQGYSTLGAELLHSAYIREGDGDLLTKLNTIIKERQEAIRNGSTEG